MSGNKVVVFGGTGFIGRSVVNELSKQGYETKVTVRRAERYRDFALFPNTKVVSLSSASDASQLKSVLEGADIVINLWCDLTSGTEMLPQDELVEAHSQLKMALDSASVNRVISLSQIGADTSLPENTWLKVVAECNSIMRTSVKADVTVVRSGLLLGKGDETASRYAHQLNRMAICPVPNGDVVVQPLAVEDFAKATVSLITHADSFGQKVELVGEERLSLQALAELVRDLMGKDDAIVFPMCSPNAKIMAFLGGLAPFQTTSSTQLKTVGQDMTSDTDFSMLAGFAPTSLEQILAKYVTPHHMRERYNYYRKEAGREASELV